VQSKVDVKVSVIYRTVRQTEI